MRFFTNRHYVGQAAIGLLLAFGLGACTTVEGTNALTDIATFEREVATETLQGLGMLEREERDRRRRAASD